MKPQGKNFIIPLIVYPFDVMVSIAQTDDELEKVLDKYLIDDKDMTWKWGNETATGRFCLFSTNQGLIRLRRSPDTNKEFGTLQHEIFHYVMHIFDAIGLKWSLKSDEAFSYLIGYLTKEIYDRL